MAGCNGPLCAYRVYLRSSLSAASLHSSALSSFRSEYGQVSRRVIRLRAHTIRRPRVCLPKRRHQNLQGRRLHGLLTTNRHWGHQGQPKKCQSIRSRGHCQGTLGPTQVRPRDYRARHSRPPRRGCRRKAKARDFVNFVCALAGHAARPRLRASSCPCPRAKSCRPSRTRRRRCRRHRHPRKIRRKSAPSFKAHR